MFESLINARTSYLKFAYILYMIKIIFLEKICLYLFVLFIGLYFPVCRIYETELF